MPEIHRADPRKSSKRIGRLIDQVRRIPEGRELLGEIDDYCAYGKTVFSPSCERQNNFNQGKQCVANWLHEKHEKYTQQKEENEDG